MKNTEETPPEKDIKLLISELLYLAESGKDPDLLEKKKGELIQRLEVIKLKSFALGKVGEALQAENERLKTCVQCGDSASIFLCDKHI